jgi:hypothetical protein
VDLRVKTGGDSERFLISLLQAGVQQRLRHESLMNGIQKNTDSSRLAAVFEKDRAKDAKPAKQMEPGEIPLRVRALIEPICLFDPLTLYAMTSLSAIFASFCGYHLWLRR